MKTGLNIRPVYAYDTEEARLEGEAPDRLLGFAWYAHWKDEALDDNNRVSQYGQFIQHHDLRQQMEFEIPQKDKDALIESITDLWWRWVEQGQRLVRHDNGKLVVVEFRKLTDEEKEKLHETL